MIPVRFAIALIVLTVIYFLVTGCTRPPEKMDWGGLVEYLKQQDAEKVKKP